MFKNRMSVLLSVVLGVAIVMGGIHYPMDVQAKANMRYVPRGGFVAYTGEYVDHFDGRAVELYSVGKLDQVKAGKKTYERSGTFWGVDSGVGAIFSNVDKPLERMDVLFYDSRELHPSSTDTVFEARYVNGDDSSAYPKIGNVTVHKIRQWNNAQGGTVIPKKVYTVKVRDGKSIDYYYTPASTKKYTVAVEGENVYVELVQLNQGGTITDNSSKEEVHFDRYDNERLEDINYYTKTLNAGYTYMFHMRYEKFERGTAKARFVLSAGGKGRKSLLKRGK